MQADLPDNTNSSLLEETQRVLGEQINIVQEQQAQATRIIRVALTVGGLLLTGISIFVSSPLFPNQGNLSNIETSTLALMSLIGLYLFLFLLIIFGKIFASALVVLSPDSGGLSILINNPVAPLLSFYRQYFLPQPFSDFLVVDEEGDQMSLRPGVDSEEIQKILRKEESGDAIVERIISYNAGCIQGNEQLINDNRDRLSDIYGIGVFAILVISLATLGGFSFIFLRLL